MGDVEAAFYERVFEAWGEFRRRLWGLYAGQRLQEPVWQTLRHRAPATSAAVPGAVLPDAADAADLAKRFTATFAALAQAYDNKDHQL